MTIPAPEQSPKMNLQEIKYKLTVDNAQLIVYNNQGNIGQRTENRSKIQAGFYGKRNL